MDADSPISLPGWDEQNSLDFIRYGHYFVPERERQIRTVVSLLPEGQREGAAFDICCGEGLLAEAILESRPAWVVYGLDGSSEMLRRAQVRLERFGGASSSSAVIGSTDNGARFRALPFDLFNPRWPEPRAPLVAAVSSLALHHLDGPGKLELFSQVYSLLASGGVFLVADMIAPADPAGWELAAREWDEAVQERAQASGEPEAFEAYLQMRWNLYRYLEPDDIDRPSPLLDQLKWLEAAGFQKVDVFWMRAGHAIFGGWK